MNRLKTCFRTVLQKLIQIFFARFWLGMFFFLFFALYQLVFKGVFNAVSFSFFLICRLIFMKFTVFHILTKVRKICKTNFQFLLVFILLFRYLFILIFFSSLQKSCFLNYLFKVNNTSNRKRRKICLKFSFSSLYSRSAYYILLPFHVYLLITITQQISIYSVQSYSITKVLVTHAQSRN